LEEAGGAVARTKLFIPPLLYEGNPLNSQENQLILLWRGKGSDGMNKIVHASIDFQGNPLSARNRNM
jgi:hypothetical protein